jgi:hypothetical protein
MDLGEKKRKGKKKEHRECDIQFLDLKKADACGRDVKI